MYEPCHQPMSRLILASVMFSALSLSGCGAHLSAPPVVSTALTKPVEAPTSAMQTQGDKNALLIAYEVALQSCAAQVDGLVNLLPKPKPKWWRFRLPDS